MIRYLYSNPMRWTYINSIIFAGDISHFTDPTFYRRMESMVILWSQAEYRQGSTNVTLGLVLVLVPKKASDGEFTAFYPELRGFMDRGEGHESAVCGTD